MTAPAGVSIKVGPESLKLDKAGEVKKFSVSLKVADKLSPNTYVFGNLVWSVGKHTTNWICWSIDIKLNNNGMFF